MYLSALENFFPLFPNVLSFQKPLGVSVSPSTNISTYAVLSGQEDNYYYSALAWLFKINIRYRHNML
jgi:hypothetical protein